MNKRKLFTYFILYTVAFAFVSIFVFFPFYSNGISLVWKIDGVPQYMLWLRYTGEYIRTLIDNIRNGHFIVKMYDFTIGMGGDVRSFFKMEPVGFLSVFLTDEMWTVEMYDILTVLRMFLAGLSFSCYAFYMKAESRAAVLAGSLAYVFCGFSYYQILRHPQFAVPVILLPLLLIGLEQVIRRKNMLFYVLMVAVSLLTSYYFLYMNTIFMGLYALLRVNEIYDKHRVKEFFQMLGRIIVSYLYGCAMAIVFFIPSIASFFLSSRGSSEKTATAWREMLAYGADRIPKLLMGFATPHFSLDYNTTVTMTALIIPAVLLLFSRKIKEKLTLKITFLLGMIFLSIPLFGYAFQGFSNVGNRWGYSFMMVCALIITAEFENFKKVKIYHYILFAASLGLYAYGVKKYYATNSIGKWGLLLLGCSIAAIVGVNLIGKVFPKVSDRLLSALLILTICLNNGFVGMYVFSGPFGGAAGQFQTQSTVDTYFQDSNYSLLGEIEDDSFYRTDTDMMMNNYNNTSVDLDYNGISYYNSTIGSRTISYYVESESVGISALNRTLSMDNRAVQEDLACVKYFITYKGEEQNVPYGFVKDETLSQGSEEFEIYTNENVLPIGYTYDSVMSRSDYEKLSALEKEQVQSETAVVDDQDMEAFQNYQVQSDYEGNISSGDLTITSMDDRLEDDQTWITVPFDPETNRIDSTAKMHFRAQSKAGCEVYVRFSGLRCSSKNRVNVNVATDDNVNKRAIVRSDSDVYSLNTENYVLNLGYYDTSEDIEGTIYFTSDLKFTYKPRFHWDKVEVFYVSMEDHDENIAALADESLENVVLDTNTVSGTVDASSDHILALSIPYHIGWKAYVDGKEVKLYNINTLYMGFPIEKGQHEVVLKYTSPGMKLGAIISLIFCLGYLIMVIIWFFKKIIHRKDKKKSKSS